MSDQAKLAGFVHVHKPGEQGVVQVFGPDDDLPDWAVRAVSNPKAWNGGQVPTFDDDGAGDGSKPPTAGKGSGVKAWKAYADAQGVSVDEKASREDIIAAVEKHETEAAAASQKDDGGAGDDSHEDDPAE